MTTPKPTILFIPGSWLPPSTYSTFLSHLQTASFPMTYATYPSLNPSDPSTTTPTADTQHVRGKYLLPLIEEESKDVVVVMHSYGGVVGSAAAKGLSKSVRTRSGGKGGVIGLIHITGFVLPHGCSVVDAVGGELSPWVKQNEPSPGLTMPHDPIAVFAADVDPEIAKKDVAQLVPFALQAFTAPAPAPAWSEPGWEGRLAYLVCKEDQAIPRFGQEAMMVETGSRWTVREMVGSHNAPFSKYAEDASGIVGEFVEGFLKLDI